ncbi:MAG: PAS domain-containing protein [Deltaproteobacteria bacterium]|jgi:signal transduction histidine kinase|nr:PAS domain-containing protein [Deltaproteobacteria bacterium]MBW2532809.1 PAS domain-containing protein [Deltaproteobacteria bacterium]
MADCDLDPRLLPLLVEHAPCWLLVVDRDHNVVLSNPALTAVFGGHEGQRCFALLKGRDRPCEPCLAAEALQQAEAREADEEATAPDGDTIPYHARAVPLRGADASADRVMVLALDRAREADLESQLSQVERLASVGLTTAGLAHTIKGILAGLEGGRYLMTSGLEREDHTRVAGAWEMVAKYVEQVSALVSNMLRYAKAERPEPEPVAPASVVQAVLELYESRAEMIGIAVERDIAPDLEPVTMDATGIHSCLANFVANAIDACAWDPDTKKQHRIRVSAAPLEDGGVILSVTDNGKGIALEDQAKILCTSFTTKGIRGTGLGLLLGKKTIEEHGGTIRFESTPGEGSTFTIELPG